MLSTSTFRTKKFLSDVAATREELEKIKGTIDPSLGNSLTTQFKSFEELVQKNPIAEAVNDSCKTLRNAVKAAFQFALAPAQTPNRQRAQQNYNTHCVGCHGPQGHGDGEWQHKLIPKPWDLQNPDLNQHASPERYFLTLLLGSSQTAMSSFADVLSTEELWDLAFYLKSLGTVQSSSQFALLVAAPLLTDKLSLDLLAQLNDVELYEWIANNLGAKHSELEFKQVLPLLRTELSFNEHLKRSQREVDDIFTPRVLLFCILAVVILGGLVFYIMRRRSQG